VPPSSFRFGVAVTFVETARLLAGRRKATRFAVLVNWVNDPVDTRILSDDLVLRIDEDNLKVLVCAVLVDPVRVL